MDFYLCGHRKQLVYAGDLPDKLILLGGPIDENPRNRSDEPADYETSRIGGNVFIQTLISYSGIGNVPSTFLNVDILSFLILHLRSSNSSLHYKKYFHSYLISVEAIMCIILLMLDDSGTIKWNTSIILN